MAKDAKGVSRVSWHFAAFVIQRAQEIEAEVDQLAAKLWGLTDQELEDIQDSLADLQ